MKSIKSFVLITLMLLFSATILFAAAGDTADDPIEINNKGDLLKLMDAADTSMPWDKFYKLTDDIVLEATDNIAPIGVYIQKFDSTPNLVNDDVTPFRGGFDGNGKTITMPIVVGADEFADASDPAENDIVSLGWGLFGYTDGAKITKLHVIVTVTGDATKDLYDTNPKSIGGIVGIAKDTEITLSSVAGTFVETEDMTHNIGGIAGEMSGTSKIEESFVTATFNTKTAFVGGFVSKFDGTISNSFFRGGFGTDAIGAALIYAGEDTGKIINSYVVDKSFDKDNIFAIANTIDTSTGKFELTETYYVSDNDDLLGFTGDSDKDNAVADVAALIAKIELDHATNGWSNTIWAIDEATTDTYNDGFPYLKNNNTKVEIVDPGFDAKLVLDGTPWFYLVGDDAVITFPTKIAGDDFTAWADLLARIDVMFDGEVAFTATTGKDSTRTMTFTLTDLDVENVNNVIFNIVVKNDSVLVDDVKVQKFENVKAHEMAINVVHIELVDGENLFETLPTTVAGFQTAGWTAVARDTTNATVKMVEAPLSIDSNNLTASLTTNHDQVTITTPTIHFRHAVIHFDLNFATKFAKGGNDSLAIRFLAIPENGKGTPIVLSDSLKINDQLEVTYAHPEWWTGNLDEATYKFAIEMTRVVKDATAGANGTLTFTLETFDMTPEIIEPEAVDMDDSFFFTTGKNYNFFLTLEPAKPTFGNFEFKGFEFVPSKGQTHTLKASIDTLGTAVIVLPEFGQSYFVDLVANFAISAEVNFVHVYNDSLELRINANALTAGKGHADSTGFVKGVDIVENFTRWNEETGADSAWVALDMNDLVDIGWTGYETHRKYKKDTTDTTKVVADGFTVALPTFADVFTRTDTLIVVTDTLRTPTGLTFTDPAHIGVMLSPVFNFPMIHEGKISTEFVMSVLDSVKVDAADKRANDYTFTVNIIGGALQSPARVLEYVTSGGADAAIFPDSTHLVVAELPTLAAGAYQFQFVITRADTTSNLVVAADDPAAGPEFQIFITNFTIVMKNEDGSSSIIPFAKNVLHGNYPNPFNPTTTISFDIKHDTHVKIDVFNIKGQKVSTIANDKFMAGRNSVVWNGTDSHGKSVGSGVYFYRMSADGFNHTKKMILVK